MPEAPISGGTRHSRISTSWRGTTFIQHTLEATNYNNNKNVAGKDPREEYSSIVKERVMSVKHMGDVQHILAEKTVEEEEADLKGGNSSSKRQATRTK